MSWRDAPLYVEAFDLAVRVSKLVDHATPGPWATATFGASADLLEGVSLALTFPSTRHADLERADRAIVCLRVLLRLGVERGALSTGLHRDLVGRSLACGRMIGGWRKRLDKRARAPPDLC